MNSNPFKQFNEWFNHAQAKSGLPNPNAMCVSTIGLDGFPNARMILLKEFDEQGFVFYTNFNSTKGQEIIKTPHVALTFHWDTLERQIRIQGSVSVVSEEESDAYFHSRPRRSQLGAWASHQSQPLQNREALLKRVAQLTQKYKGKTIPRPPHWKGFRVVPKMFEFWQGRENRLHDRIVYTYNATQWKMQRLNP